MALPTAQLGQLPSMNLGSSGHVQYNEPAWHKALAAFLVNAAGQAASNGINNAMSGDYSAQAKASGLPGATGEEQSFASKVMHGPQWDKTAYQTGMKDQAVDKRLDAQDRRLADELGLKKSEIDSLNKYRAEELTLRQKEQGSRESERLDTQGVREAELALRGKAQVDQVTNEQQRLNAEQQRWEADRLLREHGLSGDPQLNPMGASEIGVRNAQIENYKRMGDPSYAAQVEIAKFRALGVDPKTLFGETNSTTGQPPSNNSDSFNPHNTGTQSVPGGQPDKPYQGLDLSPLLQGMPRTTPSTMPPTTQNIAPTQQPNANTAAGSSSQMGQSQDMSAQPGDNAPPPITQGQPTAQAVGETGYPSDALAMVRPAQTPNSPTGILPSSAVNFMPPFTFDPAVLRRAAALARLLGQPQSVGGNPNAAGSGGLPTGYG